MKAFLFIVGMGALGAMLGVANPPAWVDHAVMFLAGGVCFRWVIP